MIIDEYDNFSNTILSTVGEEAYQKLTHGPGFFKSFFNALKRGTSGTGAPITRSFITGVSPVTMDDVTSGYNIGEQVSLDAAFNRMLGFTAADVGEILNYYHSVGLLKHDPGYLSEIMDRWYGNQINYLAPSFVKFYHFLEGYFCHRDHREANIYLTPSYQCGDTLQLPGKRPRLHGWFDRNPGV